MNSNSNKNGNDNNSQTANQTKAVKSNKSKPQKEDTSLEFIWICTECREAECATHPDSDLLVCEGPCLRPFHFPCAGLPSQPKENEKWVCNDCMEGRHQCCVCHEFGMDMKDVHKCEKKDCGLFYHEACLNMYDIDVEVEVIPGDSHGQIITTRNATAKEEITIKEQDDERDNVENDIHEEQDEESSSSSIVAHTAAPIKIMTRPKFVCPAHSCWTCSTGVPPSDHQNGNGNNNNNDVSQANDASSTTKKKGGGGKTKGKKKTKSDYDGAFCAKKDSRLFRCLYCPISYHLTCIPPSSQFHELALLCHEHASTYKLPYLEVGHSLQKDIEDRADRMFEKVREARRRKTGKRRSRRGKNDEYDDDDDGATLANRSKKVKTRMDENPFLSGKMFLNGEGTTTYQKQVVDLLLSNDELQSRGFSKKSLLLFCLPCGVQQEVHSKPPAYAHIHSNRYNPNHRPKRHPPTTEICQCHRKKSNKFEGGNDGNPICDEHCMNRILGVECIGNNHKKIKNNGEKNNPYWNCKSGPDCGNRILSQRQLAKCRPKREQGKGWGMITVNGVRRGNLVQEYVGEIIDEKMKRERLNTWSKEHPNDPNFYIMQLQSGWYIDAREKGSLSRFINHSCDPNCHLSPLNVSGQIRIAIVANRDIAPGEFLTYDYHFDTQDGDKFNCRCGATKCRGTMKRGSHGEEDNDKKLTKSERWPAAKAKLDRDKKFIDDINKSQKDRLHQVATTLPGEKTDNGNYVANGPDIGTALKARHYRVCLWRNVLSGANFSSRYWKLCEKREKTASMIK